MQFNDKIPSTVDRCQAHARVRRNGIARGVVTVSRHWRSSSPQPWATATSASPMARRQRRARTRRRRRGHHRNRGLPPPRRHRSDPGRATRPLTPTATAQQQDAPPRPRPSADAVHAGIAVTTDEFAPHLLQGVFVFAGFAALLGRKPRQPLTLPARRGWGGFPGPGPASRACWGLAL